MSLQFYEDLSWFGKILYRLHLKRAIKSFSKKDLNQLVSNTKILESMNRDVISYNDYIKKNWR